MAFIDSADMPLPVSLTATRTKSCPATDFKLISNTTSLPLLYLKALLIKLVVSWKNLVLSKLIYSVISACILMSRRLSWV